jgi:hypothetical protein
MCDVPSLTVFCSESIECFHGKASKMFFFFKLLCQCLRSLPVQSYISYPTFVVFLCINSYIIFFSASFCVKFLIAGIATSISMHDLSFWFYYIGPFAKFSLCNSCVYNTFTSLRSHSGLRVFVRACTICL